MNEPQRLVILVADRNVYRFMPVFSGPNEDMAAEFVRPRAALQEMHLREEVLSRYDVPIGDEIKTFAAFPNKRCSLR
jgi:hypothetical protein